MPFETSAAPYYHASTAGYSDISPDHTEFIPGKLYFLTTQTQPQQLSGVHYFTIDTTLVYQNFYQDVGPLNIANVFRFNEMLGEKFNSPALQGKKIVLYSSPDKAKRANAAYLLGAFMLLVLKQSPTLISQVLDGMTLINFRDAGYGNATYFISPSDCIKGLYKAIEIGLFNIDKFDAQEYEFYEKVENGDMNFITNKFLALASPKDDPVNPTMSFAAYMGNSRTVRKTSFGKEVFSAYKKADLIKFLKDRNIMTIIRLNNNVYEKQDFIDAGIEHIELYFPDGSTPPDGILKRFLDIVESREGCIAVHCKAGLGRTGSLIGAYLMKHYKMTASQTISFLRVVRPGSVVGPQQNWLESMQGKLWKMHPNSVLDTSISLLDSPCFEKSSRFLSPKIVELAARLNGSNSTEDIVMRDIRANSQISLYEMDEDPKQKGSIHALNIDVSLENDKAAKKIQLQKVLQTRVSSKDGAVEFSAEEFAIPIQPRKGKKGAHPQEELQPVSVQTKAWSNQEGHIDKPINSSNMPTIAQTLSGFVLKGAKTQPSDSNTSLNSSKRDLSSK